MDFSKFTLLSFILWIFNNSFVVNSVKIQKSAYKDIVIEINNDISNRKCNEILAKLEVTLSEMSNYLFGELNGRVYIGSVIIMLPKSWPNSCLPENRTIQVARGEKSDITITKFHPIYRDQVWTKQSSGCGAQGDQIYLTTDSLMRQQTIAKELVREWAKYRYGIFDEIGYYNDPAYPKCYRTDERQVTGCQVSQIRDSSFCDNPHGLSDASKLVNVTSLSSVMSTIDVENITKFCNGSTHNRYAPTKHNQLCNRKSTSEIILNHTDFSSTNLVDLYTIKKFMTNPLIQYKKRMLTRYVIIVDETQDILIRESWNFLRLAIRKFVVYDLPQNSEVGVILASDNSTSKLLDISSLEEINGNRDLIASFISYIPNDSQNPPCISCAINQAYFMLTGMETKRGPANSVIIIIGPGMDFNTDYKTFGTMASAAGIKITTINYPGVIRRQPLDALAEITDGQAYTIYETKQNADKSCLSTYFELTTIFADIIRNYYEGNQLDLPIEILRRKLIDVIDAHTLVKKMRQIDGNFMLDKTMGQPSALYIYTHNTEHPSIYTAKLISPKGIVYSTKSDQRLPVKQLTINGGINETGTWVYQIDRFNGDPQPHYVQVIITPNSSSILTAKAWYRRTVPGGPIILYAEVKRGEIPIIKALVEVTVSRPDAQCNETKKCEEKFLLLDTGGSDPDITKNDGIYSRYYRPLPSVVGPYRFEIIISDNGNNACSIPDQLSSGDSFTIPERCCGSFVPSPGVKTVSPFQRILPPITIFIDSTDTGNYIYETPLSNFGRIGDLRAENLDALNLRLSWTSPDMGGLSAVRYEIKYANSVKSIVDDFETAATWREANLPISYTIGDDSSFTLDMASNPKLVGNTLYFAIRPFSQIPTDAIPGPVSNYVRVYIPSPHTPTRTSTTHTQDDLNNDGVDNSITNDNHIGRNDSTEEFLYTNWPIITIFVLLTIAVIVSIAIYCYYRMIGKKYRDKDNITTAKKDFSKTDKKLNTNSNVMVIPSPSHSLTTSNDNNQHQQQHQSSAAHSLNQQHLGRRQGTEATDAYSTNGLPVYSSEEEINKNCYSIVKQQQLMTDIQNQHQQMQHQYLQQRGNYTIINHNDGKILSPFESWSASQLLHEHERRISPMDEMLIIGSKTGGGVTDHQLQQQHLDQISLINGNQPGVPVFPCIDQNEYGQKYNVYGYQHISNQPPPAYALINNRQHIQNNIDNSGINTIINSNSGISGGVKGNSSANSVAKRTRNVTMV